MKVRVFVLGDAGLVGVYLTTIPFIPGGNDVLPRERAGLDEHGAARDRRARGDLGRRDAARRRARCRPATASPPTGGRIHGTVQNHYKRGIVTQRDEALRGVLRQRGQGDRRRPAEEPDVVDADDRVEEVGDVLGQDRSGGVGVPDRARRSIGLAGAREELNEAPLFSIPSGQ